jgi:plastocyanin
MPRLRPPVRSAAGWLLTALAIALLAGCSDDRREPMPGGVVRVTLDDYAIAPQEVSVRSGRVELVARNVGRVTHNLRVEVPAGDPEEQAEPLATTPTAQPGQTVRTTVRLRPGTYRMRCSLANHDDLGMYGTILVRRRRG